MTQHAAPLPVLPHTLTVLGVRVHDVTMKEAVDMCAGFLRDAERRHQIATVNPEFIMAARRNPAFRGLLNHVSLNVPDGIGLIWASRLLGRPLRERVAGVDLVWRLAALAAHGEHRVFLLGAAPGVGETVAHALVARHPALQIAGVFAGSPAPTVEDDIVRRINASRADLLLVAYGAPAQDLWIARNLPRLSVRLALGVGGSFDFISGRAVRAPAWMQQVGLEWLHRLWREPWRWRRMLDLPRFAWAVLRQRFGFAYE